MFICIVGFGLIPLFSVWLLAKKKMSWYNAVCWMMTMMKKRREENHDGYIAIV